MYSEKKLSIAKQAQQTNKHLQLRNKLFKSFAAAISRGQICRILLGKSFHFLYSNKSTFCQKKHYIFVADLLHELLNLTGVDCSKRTLQHGFNFIIPLDIRNKDEHGNPNQSTCNSFPFIHNPVRQMFELIIFIFYPGKFFMPGIEYLQYLPGAVVAFAAILGEGVASALGATSCQDLIH